MGRNRFTVTGSRTGLGLGRRLGVFYRREDGLEYFQQEAQKDLIVAFKAGAEAALRLGGPSGYVPYVFHV